MLILANVILRVAAACLGAYVVSMYIPGLHFSAELTLGQAIFMFSLIVIAPPWHRLMRPKDLGIIRTQIPEEDVAIHCWRPTLGQDCILYTGTKQKIASFLEIMNVQALRRVEDFEEDVMRAMALPGGILFLLFFGSYISEKYSNLSQNADTAADVFQAALAFSSFAFYLGQIYGEILSERKANIAAANSVLL